jgi:hypothetical protein
MALIILQIEKAPSGKRTRGALADDEIMAFSNMTGRRTSHEGKQAY